MEENKYSTADDRGIITVTLEMRGGEPSAEDFDRLIDLLKERYPELNSTEKESDKETEDKKSPEQMNQKEFERMRDREERAKKAKRPNPW